MKSALFCFAFFFACLFVCFSATLPFCFCWITYQFTPIPRYVIVRAQRSKLKHAKGQLNIQSVKLALQFVARGSSSTMKVRTLLIMTPFYDLNATSFD